MVHERKVLQANYFLAFFIFLCLASERYILLSWYLKRKYLGNLLTNLLLKTKILPSVLISKPVLDIPRAGRLSAIAITSDTCGYGKLPAAMGAAQAGAYPAWVAVLWGVRAVSWLQASETQKHCDLFLSSRKRCAGACTDLCLFLAILSTVHPSQAQLS